jgi:hypothetical protein
MRDNATLDETLEVERSLHGKHGSSERMWYRRGRLVESRTDS